MTCPPMSLIQQQVAEHRQRIRDTFERMSPAEQAGHRQSFQVAAASGRAAFHPFAVCF